MSDEHRAEHPGRQLQVSDLLLSIAEAWTARGAGESAFRAPVVLIDGRSGSGKTDLANLLASAWGTQVTVVHLDDIYPGWGGLDEASTHIHDHLLTSTTPSWQRYDWISEQRTEWVSVDPYLPLIVEGIGSLSRANSGLATLSVWLELDEVTRRTRVLARDGKTFASHWESWAVQETAFINREQPQQLADIVLNSPGHQRNSSVNSAPLEP